VSILIRGIRPLIDVTGKIGGGPNWGCECDIPNPDPSGVSGRIPPYTELPGGVIERSKSSLSKQGTGMSRQGLEIDFRTSISTN
jgi:hypothetical protein